MIEDLDGFLERAKGLAEVIKGARSVAVVSHIDADGISSAAIAKQTLARLGIPHHLHFVKSLGEAEMETISKMTEDVVWVCDLGGPCCQRMGTLKCVVTDHHQIFDGGQSRLDLFGDMEHVLNPVLFGMNGSTYLSGAGNTYFVARELDPKNKDLAYLAIVGAVGDMQDRASNRLAGPLHKMVLDDAQEMKMVLVVENTLPFFGWVTRSAAAMLAFSNDLKAIGYSDSIKDVASLFYKANIPLRPREGTGTRENDARTVWRSWSDLGQDERSVMMVTLRDRLEELGLDAEALDGMLGEVYLFPDHPPASPTREAKEFATLLNGSGRYILTPKGDGDEERGDLIVNVCLNPTVFSESALRNVDNHKVHIKEGVKEVHRVEQEYAHIQYLLPKRKNSYCLKVNDTILGIIAGMVLDQKKGDVLLTVDPNKPIVALAEKEDSAENGKDPMVKVSTRMNRELTKIGINLGKAINLASTKVGGGGGGHDVAAGANIPRKQIKKFLTALDEEIGEQISRFSSSK